MLAAAVAATETETETKSCCAAIPSLPLLPCVDYYPNDDRAFNRRPGAAPQLGSSSVSIWLISADFILVSLVVFAFLLHTAQEHLRENAERRRDENQ